MKLLNCLLLCLTLLSVQCTDHRLPPQNQHFRVKKILSTNSQGSTTTILNYNAESKLVSFSIGDQSFNVQNDGLGRFSNVYIAGNSNAIVQRFSYDVNGNLNIILNYRYIPEVGIDLISSTFLRYSGTRYPAFSITSDSPGPRDLHYTYTFEGGNLVKLQRSINYPSQTEYLDPITHQYDDKPNPYHGLLPLGISIEESLNQNNTLVPTDELIYNSYGLLTQKNINYTGPANTRSSIIFEYETY